MPVPLAALRLQVPVPGDVAAEQGPVGVPGLDQTEQQPQPRVVALVALLADRVERDVRTARRQLLVQPGSSRGPGGRWRRGAGAGPRR